VNDVMTPEERAIRILNEGGSVMLPYEGPDDLHAVTFARGALVAAVTREITAAVANRTEASAAIGQLETLQAATYDFVEQVKRLGISRHPTCVHCSRSVNDMTGSNGGRCHALSPYRSQP
jgi:hypothetical protein